MDKRERFNVQPEVHISDINAHFVQKRLVLAAT